MIICKKEEKSFRFKWREAEAAGRGENCVKKMISLLSGMIALLLLAGCATFPGEKAEPVSRQDTAQASPKSSAQSAALTREQVRDAYNRALEAVDWFRRGNMPCEGGMVTLNGGQYRRVAYAGIETLDDLKNYLRALFSEDLVERLLAVKADGESARFFSADGRLYELQQSMENQETVGDARVSVKKKSSTCYEVDVKTKLLTEDRKTVIGVKYNAFSYEKKDGEWIFTNFELPNT